MQIMMMNNVDYATANGLDSSFAANFSSDANTDMTGTFYNAMGPGGEDISLMTLGSGPPWLSAHCSMMIPTE